MDTPTPLIHGKLAAVLAEVEAISKERMNTFQKFKFRGVDDVYNALHGLFGKHGLYVLPEVLEHAQKERATKSEGTQLHAVVKIRYHFYASDGSTQHMDVIGEAADTGDKSLGKAMQYAYKIGLLQAFLIPTEDGSSDPDANSVTWIEPAGKIQPEPKPTRTEPAGEDWVKRITDATSIVQLDKVLNELDIAVKNNEAPSSDSGAGKAINAAISTRRKVLAQRAGGRS